MKNIVEASCYSMNSNPSFLLQLWKCPYLQFHYELSLQFHIRNILLFALTDKYYTFSLEFRFTYSNSVRTYIISHIEYLIPHNSSITSYFLFLITFILHVIPEYSYLQIWPFCTNTKYIQSSLAPNQLGKRIT